MALGPQFEDTFWHKEGGELGWSLVDRRDSVPSNTHMGVFGRVPSDAPTAPNLYKGMVARQGSGDVEGMSRDARSMTTDQGEGHRAVQGLLFDPHTGTGTSRDPLLKPGEYDAAARRALGYGSVEAYQRASRSPFLPSGTHFHALDKQNVERAMTRVTRSMSDSDMPISALRDHKVTGPVLNPAGDQRDHGAYFPNGVIYVGNKQALGRPDPETLVHELGHAADSRMKFEDRHRDADVIPVSRADPMWEGAADAYEDRFGIRRLGYVVGADESFPGRELEVTQFGDPSAQVEDLLLESGRRQNPDKMVRSKGYRLGNKLWRTNRSRALYATTRTYLAEHPDAIDTLPTRQKLLADLSPPDRSLGSPSPNASEARRKRSDAETWMIGHLYDQSPAVRRLASGLPQDLEDLILKSHASYQAASQEAGRRRHNAWVQHQNVYWGRQLTEIPAEPPEQVSMFTGGDTPEKPLKVNPKAKPRRSKK